MARTKGALGKRTRVALEAVKEGQLDASGLSQPVRYMLGIVGNAKKDEALRLEAAKAAAPYLQPKLSAVEITPSNPDDKLTEGDLLERMVELIKSDPSLRQAALDALNAVGSSA